MAKKKAVKKGKKPHKNKPTSKKYTKYKIEGDKVTRQRNCPRCGPGIFLKISPKGVYCGKCHYTEFVGKKVEEENKEKSEPSKE